MWTLKVMPDYSCWPLWHRDPGEVGNIDPDTLPLSIELRAALLAWSLEFDARLNWDDPGSTIPPAPDVQDAFEQTGRELTARLNAELGSAIRFVYWRDL